MSNHTRLGRSFYHCLIIHPSSHFLYLR